MGVDPELLTGGGVERYDPVAGFRDVHHSIVYEWCGFHKKTIQWSGPHLVQLLYVAGIDLIKRAVTPVIERAPERQPVLRRLILNHGIGNGFKFRVHVGRGR